MLRRSVLAIGVGLCFSVPPLVAGAGAAAPSVRCNVPIPMSDGAVMRANVTTPGPGRHPTVVMVTGYGKGASSQCAPSTDRVVKAGYNLVVIDDRGTGSSGGRWEMWQARTQRDYVEEAQWIVRQPWSTRALGTQGESYVGITSLLFAAQNPDLVKAVYADVPAADQYRDTASFGGSLDYTFTGAWVEGAMAAGMSGAVDLATQDAGQPTGPAFFANLYDHATNAPAVFGTALMASAIAGAGDAADDRPFWREMAPIEHARDIKAAVFYTGGWFDIFQRGEPLLFNAFTHAKDVVWVQDARYHTSGTSHFAGLKWGTPGDVRARWFDHFLKGVDNGADRLPPVNLWNINGNRWDRPGQWPAPDVTWTSYYLDPTVSGSAASLNDGTLTTRRPVAAARELLPFVPVGGMCNRSTTQWAAGATTGQPCETDERSTEPTTLTYTTGTQATPLHISGPIAFDLAAALDRPDASFYVAVTDVAPDGTSTQITSGGLLASHNALDRRRSMRNAAGDIIVPYHPYSRAAQRDVPLNDPQTYRIEVFPTDWTILPGHRLRLVLGTADTAHYVVPQDRLQKMLGGTIRVISGGARTPSRLLLPLIPQTCQGARSC